MGENVTAGGSGKPGETKVRGPRRGPTPRERDLGNELVKRIAEETDVAPKEVEKVLRQLGLDSLQRHIVDITESEDRLPSVLDNGRLAVAWVAYRKIIFA